MVASIVRNYQHRVHLPVWGVLDVFHRYHRVLLLTSCMMIDIARGYQSSTFLIRLNKRKNSVMTPIIYGTTCYSIQPDELIQNAARPILLEKLIYIEPSEVS